MKFYNKLTAAAMVLSLAAFAACSEDEAPYSAIGTENGVKVVFASGNATSFSLLNEAGSFEVSFSRTDASAALSMPVSVECSKPEAFTFPTEVVFAQGESDAAITVLYDGTKLDYEEKVTFSVTIPEEYQSLYGMASYSASAMIPAPWATIGNAIYVEDFMTSFFSVKNVQYEVEVQEHQLYPGFYRLVNPYGAAYSYNEEGDWDASVDCYMEIHAEDPEKVWIPVSQHSMDWGYGRFSFGSLAGYYLAKDDPASAEEYYGKLENGVITFPKDALLISMADYKDDALYQANSGGAFLVALPGAVLADYTVTLSYEGKYYDAEDNLYVVAGAEFGSDCQTVKLALCANADADATIQGIVEGSVETVDLTAPSKVNLPMAADAVSGKYAIVAVVYANGEAQKSFKTSFNYTALGGEPVETWTPAYAGDYTYTCLFEEPTVDEDLVLSISDDDPNRCKISEWGVSGTDFIFTCDEEDNILVLDNDMDYSEDGEDLFVADMQAPCVLAGGEATWAEIINYNYAEYCDGSESDPSVVDYDTNTFTFNVVYYTAQGSVWGWGKETFVLTAGLEAPARRSFGMASAPRMQYAPAVHAPKSMGRINRRGNLFLKSIKTNAKAVAL